MGADESTSQARSSEGAAGNLTWVMGTPRTTVEAWPEGLWRPPPRRASCRGRPKISRDVKGLFLGVSLCQVESSL